MGTLTFAEDTTKSFNVEKNISNFVLPADGGYYLYCGGSVFFWDGDIEKKAMPLCSYPNCDHRNIYDCASRVMSSIDKMYEADDAIYMIGGESRRDQVTKEKQCPLWRVEKDGTGKKVVGGIPDINSMQYTILNDILYYAVQERETDGSYRTSIWQMTLDGKNKKEIWSSELYNNFVYILQGIGEWLYLSDSGYTERFDISDPEVDFEKYTELKNLHMYNPQSGEWRHNPYIEEDEALATIRNVYDNKIYMSLYDREELVQKVWRKQLGEDDELEYIGSFPRDSWSWDDEYAYTWSLWDSEKEESWFNIYNYDGECVQRFDLNYEDNIDEIVSADGKYVFVYWMQIEGNGAQEVVGVIERDKIATSEAKLIQITDGYTLSAFVREEE